jgi:ATP-dependent DNA helicase RecQ
MWPSALSEVRGAIPVPERSEEGRALSIYRDGGWGDVVMRGKFHEGAFADDLVSAAASLIRERWKPSPAPDWITAIPSRARPELVPDFARRLATRLDLPFVPCLVKVRDVRPQKEMENSSQQARNVLHAFAVEGSVPNGPLLLVDDIIDSGWTIAVATVALRQSGSGVVYPFVLAQAAGK